MNNNFGEPKEEIGARSDTASAGDESHTQRLPPGRQLDMRPRRTRALLLFTIALTLLLVSAVIAIRGNKPSDDAGPSVFPIDQSTPQATNETAPADPARVALERRVEEFTAQLALRSDEAEKKIAENAGAIRAIEEKLGSLPTMERVAVIEDSFKQSREGLAKNITRLEQSLNRLRVATLPKPVTPSAPTPPFHAVSIDLWDGVPYVGLSQDGRIELVRTGQVRGGWTVDDIDSGAGKVRFRNAAGQTVEQTLGR